MIIKIAITGRISSGKSFISSIIGKKLSCDVFDTDKIVAEMYGDAEFCKKVFANHSVFSQYLDENGVISKNKLKDAIFQDSKILQQISHLIYPELKKIILSKISISEEKYILFEVPMLLESGFNTIFDIIINIESSDEIRMERSIKKGISGDFHLLFSSFQDRDEIRRNKSHFIIINNGGDLNKAINKCIEYIKSVQ